MVPLGIQIEGYIQYSRIFPEPGSHPGDVLGRHKPEQDFFSPVSERGMMAHQGDEFMIENDATVRIDHIFPYDANEPKTVYLSSTIPENGGGGTYKVGKEAEPTLIKPGEEVFLPSKEDPKLRIVGILEEV